MNKKNFLVSLLTLASFMFLVTTASAYNVYGDLASDINIKVDDIYVSWDEVAVIAGETIPIKVYFTSDVDASNVRVKAELEGEKVDVSDRTISFDVEAGKKYAKTLTLKVPYELKDEISNDLDLNIKIWNGDFETEIKDIVLRVQRPSFNADIKSITVSKTVDAGETFPVDIVLKNIGYNDLDDLYVSVSLSALGIEKTSYFGDLVSIEENTDDDDDTDTISGRIYLKVPFDVNKGVYTLNVKVTNEDTTTSAVKQILIENDFSNNVIATTFRKTAMVSENAVYNLLVVNPTDKLKVYRIVSESSGSLTSEVDEAVVAVPAGSSKTVKITASADSQGEHNFNVDVFSGEELVDTVTFVLNAEGNQIANPIIVLTIVLAIIFLVLLVVLIVLLGKKPEKSEEFGESYY